MASASVAQSANPIACPGVSTRFTPAPPSVHHLRPVPLTLRVSCPLSSVFLTFRASSRVLASKWSLNF
eukprot:4863313-Amphidinium_carterae.1